MRQNRFGDNGLTVSVATVRNRHPLDLASPDGRGPVLVLVLSGALHLPGERSPRPVLPARSAVILDRGRAQPAITAVGDATVALVDLGGERRRRRWTGASHPMTIDADAPLLALVTTLVSSIVSPSAELSWMSRHVLTGMLTEAIRLMLSELGHHAFPPSQGLFGSAVAVIATRSMDPALTAESIAAQLNFSLRQLQRAFARQGTTIVRELRRARVEHAVTMLTSIGYADRTVDDIAREVGFSGSSCLARAMRAEGHPPPTELRAGGSGSSGSAGAASAANSG